MNLDAREVGNPTFLSYIYQVLMIKKKIKVMSILSKKIKSLNDGESFNFNYKDKKYEFCCYSYSDEKKHYSVRDASSFLGAGMNVEKITKKYISLYDYNLFNVRSTYKIPINEITIVEETKDIPGFEGTLEALNEITILK